MKLIKKAFRDLTSTLYDDQNFQVMSLPRVALATSVICVIVAWVSDQFFGFKYANLSALIGWCGINAGAYVGKKFADNGKQNNNDKGDA
jgi:hypothetical protein